MQPLIAAERLVRDTDDQAEVVISQRPVDRWAYVQAGDVLDDNTSALVTDAGHGRGTIQPGGYSYTRAVEVVKRRFREARMAGTLCPNR